MKKYKTKTFNYGIYIDIILLIYLLNLLFNIK